jgi:hypothetical protein
MDSNMNDWRMEEGVEHREKVAQVQGYAHPNDGPRRFRKDGEHDEVLLICFSSDGGGCGYRSYVYANGRTQVGRAQQERGWCSTRARK